MVGTQSIHGFRVTSIARHYRSKTMITMARRSHWAHPGSPTPRATTSMATKPRHPSPPLSNPVLRLSEATTNHLQHRFRSTSRPDCCILPPASCPNRISHPASCTTRPQLTLSKFDRLRLQWVNGTASRETLLGWWATLHHASPSTVMVATLHHLTQ